MSAVISISSRVPDTKPADCRVVGESAVWREVLARATRVAATNATVLLHGESGTGKEVVARFIHTTSPRRDGPFVAINCAAIPEQLVESELFGYERGAFTGAHLSKAGQVELASSGVLFLDEVSEMAPAAQAKLLRFLEQREFQRLGATRQMKSNARVIAATNRDLRAAVEKGTFRPDLYYRLRVFDIRLPPLRERRSDVRVFADVFLEDLGRSIGRPFSLTGDAADLLARYSWPGNVRELRNTLERAAILCDDALIGPQHLSLDSGAVATPSASNLYAVERSTIEHVMRETQWNKTKAAGRLGISRAQLCFRLRRHGLQAPAM